MRAGAARELALFPPDRAAASSVQNLKLIPHLYLPLVVRVWIRDCTTGIWGETPGVFR